MSKVMFGGSIDSDVIKDFKSLCDDNGWNYSNILQRLIKRFLLDEEFRRSLFTKPIL